MIPILFDAAETVFTSNGLGRLADCLSCRVTEERNGIFECEFTYPVTGEMYPEIQEGRIIGVIHDDAHDVQPFDIYSRSAPLNGVVTFYAHHVSYRLGKIVLKPMSAQSCAAALAAIPNNTYTDCPFTFWTNKSVSGTWTNNVPNPVRAILGGQQGSILDVYGKGEYEWDNWNVKLYVNRGNDNGVSIRYGVNLTDLTHDIDTSGVYTAVVPFWRSSEGDTVVTLDGGYVKVSSDPVLVNWTDNNDNEMTDNNGTVIEFNAEDSGTHLKSTVMDLSEAFKEQPTQEQLRAEALRRLTNSEAWLPNENIKVSFVDLSHTEEYKDVAALQRVRLCDRVSVYCGPLGVSAVSMQVIRVVFNALTERYDEIELGAAKTSFAQAVVAQVEEVTKDLPTMSMMQNAINDATEQITGAKGGHIRDIYDANGERQEMVIIDTDSIETAQNIWRWNSGGLGFSSNGYAGPYALAMTADGKIVANMITAGELDAGIIKTGVLDGKLVQAKLLQIIDDRNRLIATFDSAIKFGYLTGSNNYHLEIDYNSLDLVKSTGGAVLSIGDLRDSSGRTTMEITYIADGTTNTFWVPSIDYSASTADNVSVNGVDVSFTKDSFHVYLDDTPANGDTVIITYHGSSSVVFFRFGSQAQHTPTGSYSFINGISCDASGNFSHAEGNSCKAQGNYSHAEGWRCASSGSYSHAEGFETNSAGECCHAEGYQTYASSNSAYSPAHAEGNSTQALGSASHAEGYGTIANHKSQHVFGEYNIEDDGIGGSAHRGNYVEIVGNGRDDDERSNARTLMWNGNEWIAGTLTQASDARLKEEQGELPDVSSIRARRFRWNDKKGAHDDKDHIGYFAQDVEKVAPYLVDEDASGYKSLDYIALLCAKIEMLERKVAELEKGAK